LGVLFCSKPEHKQTAFIANVREPALYFKRAFVFFLFCRLLLSAARERAGATDTGIFAG